MRWGIRTCAEHLHMFVLAAEVTGRFFLSHRFCYSHVVVDNVHNSMCFATEGASAAQPRTAMHQRASRKGTISKIPLLWAITQPAAQRTQINSRVQAPESLRNQPASSRRRSRTADIMRLGAYLVVERIYLFHALSDFQHKTLLFGLKFHSEMLMIPRSICPVHPQCTSYWPKSRQLPNAC